MSSSHDDTRAREQYVQLLRHDEAHAKPFASVWAQALRNAELPKRASRPQRFVATASAATLLVALACALVYRLIFESARPAAIEALWSWHSPTQSLLITSDHELLHDVPHFGPPPVRSNTDSFKDI